MMGPKVFKPSDYAVLILLIKAIFVGAASCRPQIGVTDKDNGIIQARAAKCRPYTQSC